MSKFMKSGVANLYRLRFSDGRDPVEVKSSVADVVRWEKSNQGKAYTDNMTATAMLEVAFYAARRQGVTDKSHFDQFFAELDDFDLDTDDDEGEVGPTGTAASGDSSAG